MIVYKTGNLLDDDADVLVNTVNTVGVMGKGIALEFKRRYPAMYRYYKYDCEAGSIKTGKMWRWGTENGRWIVCFPTKQHWRNPSRLEWIEEGLIDLVDVLKHNYPLNPDRLYSIAIPKLGCANGGLNWDDVHPLMLRYLEPLPIEVRIYV